MIVTSLVKWPHKISKLCENAIEIEAKIKEVMASQVGVPPLTDLIYDLCH